VRIVLLAVAMIPAAVLGQPRQDESVVSTRPAATNPYLTMNSGELNSFFERLSAVSPGTEVDEVKRMLGQPFSDHVGATKEGKFVGRFLKYYMYKLSKNLVNEKVDQYVRLRFDRQDKLVNIYSNVEGHLLPPPVPPLAR